MLFSCLACFEKISLMGWVFANEVCALDVLLFCFCLFQVWKDMPKTCMLLSWFLFGVFECSGFTVIE